MSPVAAPQAPAPALAGRPSLDQLEALDQDELMDPLRRALPDVRHIPVAAFQSSI